MLEHGAVAGYVLQDVRVIVYDGKHHPVDSKEVAFVSAGKKAFLDAISKARPMVLEPIVNLDVVVPDHCMGDVTGGLATKREDDEARPEALDLREQARAVGGQVEADDRVDDDVDIEAVPGDLCRCADPLQARARCGARPRRPLRHRVQPLRSGTRSHPEAVD